MEVHMLRASCWGLALSFLLLTTSDSCAQSPANSRNGGAGTGAKTSGVSAEWLGQVGEDRVNSGVSVGPDGLADAKIVVRGLLKDVEIVGIVLKSSTGIQWHSGANPGALISSELIRRG